MLRETPWCLFMLTLGKSRLTRRKSLDEKGGEEPNVSPAELKKADFVTFPENVEGANCPNCEYFDNGVCQHDHIKGQRVNEHNCCSYWDAEGTLRHWQSEKNLARTGKEQTDDTNAELDYKTCPSCGSNVKELETGDGWRCDSPPCEWSIFAAGSKSLHKFSSTQFDLDSCGYSRSDGSPIPHLKEYQSRIPDVDLAEDGKETNFHVTVKYGLHTSNPEDARMVVRDWLSKRKNRTVSATLIGVSCFEATEYDVLKVDVDSPDLVSLNRALSKLPHTDTHPNYHPHVTLAYVKPGLGKKYSGEFNHPIMLHQLSFSDTDRHVTLIDLWEELSNPQFSHKAMSYLATGSGGALVPPPAFGPKLPQSKLKRNRSILDSVKSLREKYKRKDLTGWITPTGAHLEQIESHSRTLQSERPGVLADLAIDEGYVWMRQNGDTVYLECTADKIPMATRFVQRYADDGISKLNITTYSNGNVSGTRIVSLDKSSLQVPRLGVSSLVKHKPAGIEEIPLT